MKVLFFTPTGARTGSEMVLWYLMKQLNNTNIESGVYSRQAGELFSNESPTPHTFINKSKKGFLYGFLEGIYHKIFNRTFEENHVRRIHRQFKPDYWYFNTITMPELAQLAVKLNVPYIVHVHEMVSIYDEYKAVDFARMMEQAKMVIGCSSPVVKQLKQMELGNVQLLHEFVDTQKITVKQPASLLRQQLNIPADAFIWFMSGTMCMRKGTDFVPDVLSNLPKNVYLLWLGSESEYGVYHYVKQRVKNENLNFIALGSKGGTDYYDYLNLADGFVLLAREDPFPLVMIEAAYLQKPIVGFESGGVAEFVQSGMGLVVPAFDIQKLTTAMTDIADGKLLIDKVALRQRAETFDVKNQVSKWQELLNELR
jgi:L-malate glycosyltransferase